MHSHAKPLIPGAGKVKPAHTRFAVPEPSPGPNAKSGYLIAGI